MSLQNFQNCNRLANNNLNNKGNLSEFLKAYLVLATSLGKEQIAYEGISELPPASAFDNPDPRVDIVISMAEQSLVKQTNVEMPTMTK